jgi:colanic acid biosynthesis glycosyl transferase WcaI
VRVRVCFFNRSYWPDTGATGQLLTELAEDLANRHGCEVTVITGYPIAGDDVPPPVALRNGVRVIRARGTRFAPRRFTGRALNYLTYFASAVWAGVRLPRQDVTVAMTDPPIIGLAALAARPRRGFIFLCQDVFPEVASLLEDFHSRVVNAMLERLNRYLVRRANRIIVLGETMMARLVDGKGADPRKITIIHNWADTTAIVPSPKQNDFAHTHGLASRFVVLHAGNIGMSQNLDVVIDAAALLVNHPDVLFLFIGDGNRRAVLEQNVKARGLSNVRFIPFQPRDQLRWTYAASDVCLVSLKPGLAGYIVPSKLYPILAAGRPYIAAVESTAEVAALTERHRTGLVVEPGNAAQLAEAVLRLAGDGTEREEMGVRARAASELFSRERQVAAHAAVIEELARS